MAGGVRDGEVHDIAQ